MNHSFLIAFLLLSPLLGFVINGVRYKHHSANLSGTIATIAVAISFILSVILAIDLVGMPVESRRITADFFQWISVDKFRVNVGFVVDQISAIMILIITGVGSLIHMFSIGYMHHDKGAARYFSYLNLFIFNMLVLVLGDSLVTLFVGWEGVGLCSYLLIGFWFTDKEKAAAGMKAFITNRMGDAAFLLGMFVLFFTFGTLNIQELNSLAPTTVEASWLGAVTLGTLFLFIGATGKSAQIPLYVWLPDAMAGPTPVSALIHAATMVTAGIYMIVRLNPIFMVAPNTMMVIAVVGGLTAILAASIGMTQWDIKKILAYSTVSQLGYMFLAAGVGAFSAAMFHLMTHAFFKALMFLGSGSVIHAMHEEQDIRKMGGLAKYLPVTHITFVLGWLAIIGIPPFAGFFSKDEILWMSFHSPLGHWSLWAVGAIGAAMTAFYMTRLMCLTFWGKSRVPKNIHPHESPALMTIPLVVLGLLSVVGGWIGIPKVISHILPGEPGNIFEHWLEPLIKAIPNATHAEASLEWTLMGVSVTIAVIAAMMARQFYLKSPQTPEKLAHSLGPIYRLVSKKFLVDELYFRFLINPLIETSKGIWYYIDVNFIDRCTYWVADLVKGAGSFVRSTQSGNLQQYAMYIGLGIVAALSFILLR
ncbi:MAG: NADH-quinone oxidoreductase subunit L [Bdellovibrionaceae bacterium]|nr:NADH-quinone oxidoreductase subunit L [Pseudobdellovibrionaceae bacterium]